ncbi:TSC22 domain family protein 1-like [Notechis scutatus]|uniref:TSC22 domain family protein 1 n=1 Tax=Notechis scutatus TaxID=8663 RepID=A0A6J1VMQ0_9SAUR|nr:TSC22 domain family protein 1-like [Notechis scutatus]
MQQQQQQQQPDSAAEARERKKMAQPAMLPRRGGSGAGLEDFPPGLLVQPPPAAPAAAASSASSSSVSVSVSSCPPGAPPPQSLALLSQAGGGGGGGVGPAGAQLKKKSGFQITSVTPAQISASLSSNNSIAEDTESYDDLDESHTEDFSSSEILDVSLSRATDLGEPERSSSEETLNNFHEADSPGAVSPNQPRPPAQQPRGLTNGSAHGPHYAHGGLPQPPSHAGVPPPVSAGSPSSPSFRRLPVAGGLESARPGPAGASSVAALAGATVAHFHAGAASAGGAVGASGRARQVGKTLTNLAAAGNGMALPGGSHSGHAALSGGIGNGTGASSNASGSVGHSAAGGTAVGHLQPSGSTSRFRVVKLDSSSEHFKKGRWTCTEFYDKENPGAVAENAAMAKAMDALLDVASERESTSGSSVSSTLSHYTESVGSGEMGAPPGTQPQGFQGGPLPMEFTSAGATPGLPQSMSQSQLSQVQPPHPQEVSYPPQKQGAPPPASAVPPPLTIVGGHQPTLASQPFTPPPVSAGPVAPQPQPLPFGPGQAQHPAALPPMPRQMAPGQHAKPVAQTSLPEYIQPPQMLPAPSLQPGTAIVGSGSAVPVAQPPSMPLPVQAHLPGVPPQAQPAIPAVGAPTALMNVGQPGGAAPMAQRPSVANPMAPSVLGPSAAVPAPSQGAPPVPTGAVHPGSQSVPSGLPQTLGIPPPGNLVPMQAADPLVQGMAQLPPVSPIPSVSALPGHSASSMPPAPVGLAPSKTLAQPPSSIQNGSLVQNAASQPALLPTGMNLPGAPSSSQFSAQSLAQSIMSRTEEAKRPAEAFLVGLTQPLGGAESSGLCTSSALADGSMVSSLFPLKGLPLAALDGEEDSSSGASVVAIDNKIEQAMDLVKSHLMYAVREEVEVLKEQIKELVEKNNQLEQENNLLKTLASPEQLAQFQAQLQTSNSPAASSQAQGAALPPSQAAPQNSGPQA